MNILQVLYPILLELHSVQGWHSSLQLDSKEHDTSKYRRLEIYFLLLKFSPQPQVWEIHDIVLQWKARNHCKVRASGAPPLPFLVRPIRYHISGVVFKLVEAKVPYQFHK